MQWPVDLPTRKGVVVAEDEGGTHGGDSPAIMVVFSDKPETTEDYGHADSPALTWQLRSISFKAGDVSSGRPNLRPKPQSRIEAGSGGPRPRATAVLGI